jgi:hypothetical protein
MHTHVYNIQVLDVGLRLVKKPWSERHQYITAHMVTLDESTGQLVEANDLLMGTKVADALDGVAAFTNLAVLKVMCSPRDCWCFPCCVRPCVKNVTDSDNGRPCMRDYRMTQVQHC